MPPLSARGLYIDHSMGTPSHEIHALTAAAVISAVSGKAIQNHGKPSLACWARRGNTAPPTSTTTRIANVNSHHIPEL